MKILEFTNDRLTGYIFFCRIYMEKQEFKLYTDLYGFIRIYMEKNRDLFRGRFFTKLQDFQDLQVENEGVRRGRFFVFPFSRSSVLPFFRSYFPDD
jgi:hypothetical protein